MTYKSSLMLEVSQGPTNNRKKQTVPKLQAGEGESTPRNLAEILLHFSFKNTFDSKTVRDLIMKLTSSRACFLKTYYPE